MAASGPHQGEGGRRQRDRARGPGRGAAQQERATCLRPGQDRVQPGAAGRPRPAAEDLGPRRRRAAAAAGLAEPLPRAQAGEDLRGPPGRHHAVGRRRPVGAACRRRALATGRRARRPRPPARARPETAAPRRDDAKGRALGRPRGPAAAPDPAIGSRSGEAGAPAGVPGVRRRRPSPTTRLDAPAATGGSYGVQLASSPVEADANAAFAKLKKKYPAQLGAADGDGPQGRDGRQAGLSRAGRQHEPGRGQGALRAAAGRRRLLLRGAQLMKAFVCGCAGAGVGAERAGLPRRGAALGPHPVPPQRGLAGPAPRARVRVPRDRRPRGRPRAGRPGGRARAAPRAAALAPLSRRGALRRAPRRRPRPRPAPGPARRRADRAGPAGLRRHGGLRPGARPAGRGRELGDRRPRLRPRPRHRRGAGRRLGGGADGRGRSAGGQAHARATGAPRSTATSTCRSWTRTARRCARDFAPFRALNRLPMAMTAHIVFRALDPDRPVTTSRRAIDEVVRGEIGFDGLLLSDDLSMEALKGTPRRARRRGLRGRLRHPAPLQRQRWPRPGPSLRPRRCSRPRRRARRGGPGAAGRAGAARPRARPRRLRGRDAPPSPEARARARPQPRRAGRDACRPRPGPRQAMPSHCARAERLAEQHGSPASAATAGSTLSSTPKVCRGRRRRAYISSEKGRALDSSATPRPSGSRLGSRSAAPARATPNGQHGQGRHGGADRHRVGPAQPPGPLAEHDVERPGEGGRRPRRPGRPGRARLGRAACAPTGRISARPSIAVADPQGVERPPRRQGGDRQRARELDRDRDAEGHGAQRHVEQQVQGAERDPVERQGAAGGASSRRRHGRQTREEQQRGKADPQRRRALGAERWEEPLGEGRAHAHGHDAAHHGGDGPER